MAAPPPTPPILNTYLSLLRTFSSFLTVAIHTILYERAIYPPSTFLSARAYNFPVRQSRHPKVCSWVNDAVAAVETEMLKGKVARVAVVIYSPDAEVMERFMFDVSSFPVVEFGERFTEFEPRDGEERGEPKGKEKEGEGPVHVAEEPPFKIATLDIQEQLRATIRKLAYSASKLDPLPDDCTFTVTVELKPDAVPPVEVSILSFRLCLSMY
jgi:mitotic spindle assembly checkpoint protein MAD2B